jgi:AI-2E family transporter
MRKQVAHRAPLFFSTVRQQTDSCRGQAAGPGRLEHARGHHRSSGIAAHDDRHHHLRDLHLAAASRPNESFVHLAGSDDIQRTTTALDEAGERLSRLFLTQIAFNAAFGVAIGIGLQLIGVPSAHLWGLVAMILRFVPYIGAFISAIFPLILAAAVGIGLGNAFADGGPVRRPRAFSGTGS